MQAPYQGNLFRKDFEEYLAAESHSRRGNRSDVALELQQAILAAGITTDDEIAHCLARIVADAVRKPYFEYRDFLPRSTGSLVAEAEEARYFAAILKTLSRGYGDAEVAFLIDEFEEIGLQKRLTKRDAHDYLATVPGDGAPIVGTVGHPAGGEKQAGPPLVPVSAQLHR